MGYPEPDVATGWQTDLGVTVSTHEDAVALPLVSGGRRGKLLVGALYERSGRLIGDSQRAKRNRAWSGNPLQVDLPPTSTSDHLPGRTFFAGHLLHIFGHLLLELVPRFWPALDYSAFDRVLLYPARAGRSSTKPSFAAYEQDTLSALGIDPSQAVAVGDRPIGLDEVTVSTPAFVLKRGVDPSFVVPFDRLRASFGAPSGGSRRVYLSRTRLADRHRAATNEDEIEMIFAAAGFEIVHPQELSIAEQVALVGSSSAIAGCDGSALHLGAFARPGTVLLAIDSRVVLNQFMLDRVRGLHAVHVLAADAALDDRASAWRADLDAVRAGLAVAGLEEA